MNITFAGVVEEVKQLSLDEKQELKDLLESYVIEERRNEIYENGELSREKLKNGELEFFSDVDEMMRTLND